jgi:GNAT superfamily N-acetyltransferase
MNDIKIRYATEIDMSAIYNLIMELAIYEHAAEEVKIDESQLLHDFQAGIFQAQVAVNSADEVVGTVIYYITFSTWKGKMMYLEDFVVKESARRQGIGKLLFDAVIAAAKKQDCNLMKWQVLDWNEPAINFYKSYNATIEEEWFNGKIIF